MALVGDDEDENDGDDGIAATAATAEETPKNWTNVIAFFFACILIGITKKYPRFPPENGPRISASNRQNRTRNQLKVRLL